MCQPLVILTGTLVTFRVGELVLKFDSVGVCVALGVDLHELFFVASQVDDGLGHGLSQLDHILFWHLNEFWPLVDVKTRAI